MSKESAFNQIKKYNLEDRIITFTSSSATVELAAQCLNCEPDQIAKTMAFDLKDRYIVIVTSGEARIDNKKFKEEFKMKAKMVDRNILEEKVGHEPGGVCPFGLKENVDVYLDESLKKYDIVYPACGLHNNAIKLTINELEQVTSKPKWIKVTN